MKFLFYLKFKVKQSEQNLAAQHQVLMQQQKHQTEEALKQHEEKHLMQMAQDCGVNLVEFDHLLMPIMESCTKESISQGKAWILGYAQQSNTSLDVITKFLLFKSTRSSKPIFILACMHI
jgi:calcium homeostasis endoplasmic reticulum protein